jgi:hypothetical protein
LWLLEKLGFPWILSSESRLINGLRGIFARIIFLAASCLTAAGDAATEAVRMHRIIHDASLARFRLFVNRSSP